jgi:predicted DNA-binding transcriptional regulator AlpA
MIDSADTSSDVTIGTSRRPAVPRHTLLISVPEAATLAGLSKAAAYRLAALDALPGLVKLPGCQLMVRRRVLEAWLGGTEVPQPSLRPGHRAPADGPRTMKP